LLGSNDLSMILHLWLIGRAPAGMTVMDLHSRASIAAACSLAVYLVPVLVGAHAIVPWALAIGLVLMNGTGVLHTLAVAGVAALAQISAALVVYFALGRSAGKAAALLLLAVLVFAWMLTTTIIDIDRLDASRYPARFKPPVSQAP
jgi:hypothetical protein